MENTVLTNGFLLNKKEAAKLLNCSVRSIDHWKSQGLLAYVKVGCYVRFERSSLLDFVQNHQINSKNNNLNMANGQEGK